VLLFAEGVDVLLLSTCLLPSSSGYSV